MLPSVFFHAHGRAFHKGIVNLKGLKIRDSQPTIFHVSARDYHYLSFPFKLTRRMHQISIKIASFLHHPTNSVIFLFPIGPGRLPRKPGYFPAGPPAPGYGWALQTIRLFCRRHPDYPRPLFLPRACRRAITVCVPMVPWKDILSPYFLQISLKSMHSL